MNNVQTISITAKSGYKNNKNPKIASEENRHNVEKCLEKQIYIFDVLLGGFHRAYFLHLFIVNLPIKIEFLNKQLR